MSSAGVLIVADIGVLCLKIINKFELEKHIPTGFFSNNENNLNHQFIEYFLKVFYML